MYCVRCKKSTDTSHTENTVSKNNRHMIRGKCVVCGTTKTQFIKSSATSSGAKPAAASKPSELKGIYNPRLFEKKLK